MKINYFYNIAKLKLFCLPRSITGKGTLKTLQEIKKKFSNFNIKSFKSGSKVYDWVIPAQWEIYDAYVMDKNNKKIINFKDNNLHIVGYSHPLSKKIKLNELIKKFHTLPNQPRAIPYVTSYYKKYWGFCISYERKQSIIKKYNSNDLFKVVIKSKFIKKGKLNYGEIVIPGKSKQEILISTYICHPSMANNELSGPIVSMSLIDYFKKKRVNKTLRFIFIPETIGSIAYINKNIKNIKKNVIGAYNITCVGDERQHSCMLSKYKNALSDITLLEAYKKKKIKPKIYSFLKRGSDERQFNSPGVDIPMTSIFRSKYGEYPEYHTSLDNFKVVTIKGLKGAFEISKLAIKNLSKKIIPVSKHLCEPKLDKINLYPTISKKLGKHIGLKLLDFLQYCDGKNDMDNISKLIKTNDKETNHLFKILSKNKLIHF